MAQSKNIYDSLGTPISLEEAQSKINSSVDWRIKKGYINTRYGKIRVLGFDYGFQRVKMAKQLLKATKHLI